MTGPGLAPPQRRDEDGGWFARGRAWWTRNWSITAGIWLALLSAWIIKVSLEVRSSEQASNHAAKVACQRSATLGPQLADYYARDPAFPNDVLKLYRKTIPKVCPK